MLLASAIWHVTADFGEITMPRYTACVSGRYGSACEGLCACNAYEDCSDGISGDGRCTCQLGKEELCGIASPLQAAPIHRTDEGDGTTAYLNDLEHIRWRQDTLSHLRVDPSTARGSRQVYNVTVSRVLPTPFSALAEDLVVLAANTEVIEALGIHPSELSSAQFTEVFSGRKILPGSSPFAHAYGGHQFGYWSGQLGDGRSISLGDIAGWALRPAGGKSHTGIGIGIGGDELSQPLPFQYEVALKGSGKTPYSRAGIVTVTEEAR